MAYTATISLPDPGNLLSTLAHSRPRSKVTVKTENGIVQLTIHATDDTAFRASLHSLLQELTIIHKTKQIT